MSRIKDVDQLLANWAQLNLVIMQLTEKEVLELLDHERYNRGRLRTMLRLYNRYSKLRSQREKREIGKDAKA